MKCIKGEWNFPQTFFSELNLGYFKFGGSHFKCYFFSKRNLDMWELITRSADSKGQNPTVADRKARNRWEKWHTQNHFLILWTPRCRVMQQNSNRKSNEQKPFVTKYFVILCNFLLSTSTGYKRSNYPFTTTTSQFRFFRTQSSNITAERYNKNSDTGSGTLVPESYTALIFSPRVLRRIMTRSSKRPRASDLAAGQQNGSTFLPDRQWLEDESSCPVDDAIKGMEVPRIGLARTGLVRLPGLGPRDLRPQSMAGENRWYG